eukprot:539852-Pleurochrysis_carterae.AAC.1
MHVHTPDLRTRTHTRYRRTHTEKVRVHVSTHAPAHACRGAANPCIYSCLASAVLAQDVLKACLKGEHARAWLFARACHVEHVSAMCVRCAREQQRAACVGLRVQGGGDAGSGDDSECK